MRKVSEFMTKQIIVINSEEKLIDIINIMREKRIGSVLIEENNDIVGIFTERDLLLKPDFQSGSFSEIKMKDVMTTNLKTVPWDTSYIDVMEMMQVEKVRHMPITKDNKIIGIVSLRDLLKHYYEHLEYMLQETVRALSSAVEKRDPYTAGHQQRVAQLACEIAREMGLSEKDVSGVNICSIVHDIGKLYIPTEILNKPGKLTEAEMTLIRIHPQIGYDILKTIQFPWPVADAVLQHHERLDGSGYPNRLTAEKIVLEAKIIAVADTVEAMATNRPYRFALGIDKALEEIEANAGKGYDENVVKICLDLFRNKGFQFTQEIY